VVGLDRKTRWGRQGGGILNGKMQRRLIRKNAWRADQKNRKKGWRDWKEHSEWDPSARTNVKGTGRGDRNMVERKIAKEEWHWGGKTKR